MTRGEWPRGNLKAIYSKRGRQRQSKALFNVYSLCNDKTYWSRSRTISSGEGTEFEGAGGPRCTELKYSADDLFGGSTVNSSSPTATACPPVDNGFGTLGLLRVGEAEAGKGFLRTGDGTLTFDV